MDMTTEDGATLGASKMVEAIGVTGMEVEPIQFVEGVGTDNWVAGPSVPGRLELAAKGTALLEAKTTDCVKDGNGPELGVAGSGELDPGGLLIIVDEAARTGDVGDDGAAAELGPLVTKDGLAVPGGRGGNGDDDGAAEGPKDIDIDGLMIIEDGRATIGVAAELMILRTDAILEKVLLKPRETGGSRDCDGFIEEPGSTELDSNGLMSVELGRAGGSGTELVVKGTKLSTGGKENVVKAVRAGKVDTNAGEELDMPEPRAGGGAELGVNGTKLSTGGKETTVVKAIGVDRIDIKIAEEPGILERRMGGCAELRAKGKKLSTGGKEMIVVKAAERGRDDTKVTEKPAGLGVGAKITLLEPRAGCELAIGGGEMNVGNDICGGRVDAEFTKTPDGLNVADNISLLDPTATVELSIGGGKEVIVDEVTGPDTTLAKRLDGLDLGANIPLLNLGVDDKDNTGADAIVELIGGSLDN